MKAAYFHGDPPDNIQMPVPAETFSHVFESYEHTFIFLGLTLVIAWWWKCSTVKKLHLGRAEATAQVQQNAATRAQ